MKIKSITHLLFVGFLVVLSSSCNKEVTPSETSLSYTLLSGKTWYLAYSQTTTDNVTTTKSYVGQSTYFINFSKKSTIFDADGMTGFYSLQIKEGLLLMKVEAKTLNGNSSNYQYDIISLGAKKMILSYSSGITIAQLCFTTQE